MIGAEKQGFPPVDAQKCRQFSTPGGGGGRTTSLKKSIFITETMAATTIDEVLNQLEKIITDSRQANDQVLP